MPTSKNFRRDFAWVLSLFGTAVGAGVLYLPIQAGSAGLWVLIAASIFIIPMTWLSHSKLTTLVAASETGGDITEVVEQYLGRKLGLVVSILYFCAIISILLIYAIGITNAVRSFIHFQMHGPLYSRTPLSISLIVAAIGIVLLGQGWLLRIAGILVYPLMLFLVVIAFYLIPFWQPQHMLVAFSFGQSLRHLLLVLPVLVFAMNFSPICSTFAQAYRKDYPDPKQCVRKTDKIILINVLIMCLFVLFFVYSCAFCLTRPELREALAGNFSAMTIVSRYSHSSFISYLGPFITIIAILTSLFGHFMGAREGLNGCFIKILRYCKPVWAERERTIDALSVILIILLLWFVAVKNYSIITIISVFVAPVIAMILYILPVITIRYSEKLRQYRTASDWPVAIIGVIVILGYVLGQLLPKLHWIS